MPQLRLRPNERDLLNTLVELSDGGAIVVHENMPREERETLFELTCKGLISPTSRVYARPVRHWTVEPTERGYRYGTPALKEAA